MLVLEGGGRQRAREGRGSNQPGNGRWHAYGLQLEGLAVGCQLLKQENEEHGDLPQQGL